MRLSNLFLKCDSALRINALSIDNGHKTKLRNRSDLVASKGDERHSPKNEQASCASVLGWILVTNQ